MSAKHNKMFKFNKICQLKKNSQSGLTILEVVIATMLLMVVGFALVILFSLGLQQLTRAKMLTMATSLAQAKMEEAIAKAPGKLDSLSGTFTSKPDYSFNVSYSPDPSLPALQTALVEVKGLLGVNAVFAMSVPAGGYLFDAAPTQLFSFALAQITGLLDTTNRQLTVYSVPWDSTGITFHLNLPSNLTITKFKVMWNANNSLEQNTNFIFLDTSVNPPRQCIFGISWPHPSAGELYIYSSGTKGLVDSGQTITDGTTITINENQMCP